MRDFSAMPTEELENLLLSETLPELQSWDVYDELISRDPGCRKKTPEEILGETFGFSFILALRERLEQQREEQGDAFPMRERKVLGACNVLANYFIENMERDDPELFGESTGEE